jgi:hypothetical protein
MASMISSLLLFSHPSVSGSATDARYRDSLQVALNQTRALVSLLPCANWDPIGALRLWL